MKITGAIFDADGTLFDSMFVWDGIGENYLRSKGKEPDEDFETKIKGMYLREAIDYILEEYEIDDSAEKAAEDAINLAKKVYLTVKYKDGIPELLEFLKGNGVKMCLATSSERDMIEPLLKRLEFDIYFDFIITSAEVGNSKRCPDIYLSALDKLGTDINSTFVFEDTAFAAQTAKNAGFKVCGVYDEHEKNQMLLKEKADLYIKTFDGAIKYFE